MIDCEPKLEIYKFYFDLFRYFNLSSTNSVSKWKTADLDNVVKWSKLCEEINRKMKKKPYYTKFIDKIYYLKNKETTFNNNNDFDINNFLENATFIIKKVIFI